MRGDDGDEAGNYGQLQAVFETARRHNQSLSTDTPPTDDYTPAEGLRVVDEVLARAPSSLRENVKDLFRDLDTLAAASRKKNLMGPFAALGGLAGRFGTVAGGFAAGGLPGAAMGGVAALGGNSMPARAGRAIGGFVDRAAGLELPAPVLARTAARRAMRKAGVEEVRPSNALLSENDAMMANSAAMRRVALGLQADVTATPAEEARRLAAPRLAREAAVNASPEAISGWRPDSTAPALEGQAPDLVAPHEDPASVAFDGQPQRRAAARIFAEARKAAPGIRTWPFAEDDSQSPASDPEASPASAVPPASVQASGDPSSESLGPVDRAKARMASLPPAAAQQEVEPTTQGPPRSVGKGALRGWRNFVQEGIGRKGRVATRADIEGAVKSLAEDGTLEPDEAGAMLAEAGRIEDYSLLDEIIQRVADRQGWSIADSPNMQLTAGGAAPQHYAGIRAPAQWEGAKGNYQEAAMRAIHAGEAAGDYPLVELANVFATNTDKVLPGPVRVLRVEALIAASADPSTAARRKAYLRPLVARYTKPPE